MLCRHVIVSTKILMLMTKSVSTKLREQKPVDLSELVGFASHMHANEARACTYMSTYE